MIKMSEWNDAQEWERKWHDNCANSYHEETKQFTYARKMGLSEFQGVDRGGRQIFDFKDKTVIDIGGGAYSLLLKAEAKERTVVDPCAYPNWVRLRYSECGVNYFQVPAEYLDRGVELPVKKYDIALIYNCLQHTIDPEEIIKQVKKIAHEIRIFEWIENGVSDGHPHDLKAENLDTWLGGTGKVERINEGGAVGLCYYGIFPTL